MESHAHFELQYQKNAFFSPKNIAFALYDRGLWLKAQTFIKESSIVVDLGAGGGTMLYNVARLTSAKLIAVDFSDFTCAQLKHFVPQAMCLKEDVTHTSLPDGYSDCVISTMTIEHVDDAALIREALRILSPGGTFLVSSVLRSRGARYFYKNASGETVLELTHLREYSTVNEFTDLLTKNGFKIEALATPRVRYPLLDPLLKFIFGCTTWARWRQMPSIPLMEWLRLITRIPIPGYYAIEVLAKKV